MLDLTSWDLKTVKKVQGDAVDGIKRAAIIIKNTSPVIGIQKCKSVQRLHACTGALDISVINHDVTKDFTAIKRFKQLSSPREFISSPTTVFVLHG
jgi:hypothetical protein